MSSDELKEILEDSIHLAAMVVDEHFGSMEDIREENQDREEVEYVKEMKIRTYDTLLRELIKWKLDNETLLNE
jgi:uncharacterized protein YgfB (UPF0149 family)